MTKKQILELLKSSKWTHNSKNDLFTDDESSETLAIWDKDHAFTIHGVRNIFLKDNIVLVVTQMRPSLKYNIQFDAIEPVLNNSMKYMFREELLRNKKEHNEFLKG
jgi:hypothetical protein